MTLFGSSLLWCVLQVSVFLGLAAPIYLAVRRKDPRAGTQAAVGSLSAVLALTLLVASPWPRWSWEVALPLATASREAAPTATLADELPGMRTTAQSTQQSSQQPPVAADLPPSFFAAFWQALQNPAPATSETAARSAWQRASTALLALLGIGMLFGLTRLALGLFSLRKLVERSKPINSPALAMELANLRRNLTCGGPVALRESSEVVTPATVGWRRPVILLPAAWPAWSPVERRSVLAHELSHIARNDFGASLVGRVAVVLHFYHPLVRWFARRLQLDQELAADATASRLVGGRTAYLHALANLALATPPHRLAGPARTFIPSRSLLIRRVEMLRSSDNFGPLSFGRRPLARVGAFAALAICGVIASGLRPGSENQLSAAETPTTPKTGDSAYNFAYVPDEFVSMFAIRPRQLADSPRLKPLADIVAQATRPNLPIDKLDQVTMVFSLPQVMPDGSMKPGTGSEFTVIRTTEPVDFAPLLEAGYGKIKTEAHDGKQLMTWDASENRIAFFSPDRQTLIGHPKAGLLEVMKDPNASDPPQAAKDWTVSATGPLFGVINAEALGKMLPREGVAAAVLGPIVEATDRATVSVEDGDPAVVRATLELRDASQGPMVQKTLESAILIGRNIIASQRITLANQVNAPQPGGFPAAARQDAERTLSLLDAVAKLEVKVVAVGNVVTATVTIDDVGELVANQVAPALEQARGAARQAVAANNLKQLALAMHLYHDSYKTFPPAVVYGKSSYGALNPTGDDASDVPRSWRVELLPLLEQAELYKQYRLDQPWDSEANLKVLAKMPDIFRSPYDAVASTNASYFAVTGPGTLFDDKDGSKFADITDGTSQTILFVEAKQPTPWTKPEDIDYAPDKPLPKFGGWQKGGFVAVYADGSSRTLDSFGHGDAATGDEAMRMLIEKADGKVASDASRAAVAPPVAPPPQP